MAINKALNSIFRSILKGSAKEVSAKTAQEAARQASNASIAKLARSLAGIKRPVVTPRTKGVGTFKPHTSTLSVREQLGFSKGAWNDLNKSQREALEDFAQHVLSGKNKTKFIWSPEKQEFRYGKTVQRLKGEIEGAQKLASMEGSKVAPNAYVKAGPVTYFPQINQAGISMVPKGQTFGELRYKPRNKQVGNIVLTSPRVDAFELENAIRNSLPNRIDKESMKLFWKGVNQTARPGTYITGDIPEKVVRNIKTNTLSREDIMPLGGYMIQANSPSKAVKILLEDAADKGGSVVMGLSPDSYKAIIKQGLRPEHNLRFARSGFTKLNGSAVDNAALYEQWQKAVTPELKEQFVRNWNQQIYPRTASINTNGEVEFLQPYIYIKKHGGKL